MPASDDPTREAPPPALRRIGRFELVREIARGGMGVVYEGLGPDLGRRVALKVLQKTGDEQADRRFQREAALAARLSHPGIIPIHEVGLSGGRRYIAMALIEGRTLHDVMPGWPLERNVAALEQVARAVGHAHQAGVTHRDLKPANILLDAEDRPVVTDFGLAAAAGGESRLTRTGEMLGTTHYMAPEQVVGRTDQQDARTDVWALGVMLYEMLGGERPFRGPEATAIFHKILNADPAPHSSRVPRELQTICRKALSKERARRYPDATAFAEELHRWRTGEPIEAVPPSALYRIARRIRRHPWWLAGALCVLLAALLIGGGHVLRRRERALEAERSRARQGEAYRTLSQQLEPIARRIEETRTYFYLAQADIQAKLREVQAALDELSRLADSPAGRREPRVWALLGSALHFLGRDRQAEQALRRARELGDGRADYHLGRIYLERAMADLLAHRAEELRQRARHWTRLAQDCFARPDELSGVRPLERDLARAFGAIAAGRTTEARKLCEAGVARHTGVLGVEEFWMLLGWVRPGPRRIEAWNRALQLRPHSAWLLLLRGSLSLQTEQLEEARRDHEAALAINPRLALGWANLGIARRKLGDAKGAIAAYDRAIALAPELATPYLNRGVARRARGDITGAIADYDRCLARFPDHARAYCNRAVARQARGDLEGAIDDLDRAIAIDPRYAEAYNNRGGAHRAAGRLPAAEADYTKAIEHNPRYATAHSNRAAVRQERRNYKGALADLDRAIALDPRLLAARVNRGNLLQALGRLDAALADFDRALALDPRRLEAWLNRATLRLARGDLPGALSDCDQAVKLAPGSADALSNRGTVRRAAGRAAEALQDFQRAIQLRPGHWQAWAGYGLVLADQGRKAPAREAWARAAALAPPAVRPQIRAWIERSR